MKLTLNRSICKVKIKIKFGTKPYGCRALYLEPHKCILCGFGMYRVTKTSCWDCGEDTTIEGGFFRDLENTEVICWDCGDDIEYRKENAEARKHNALSFCSSMLGYLDEGSIEAILSCYGVTRQEVEDFLMAKKFTPRMFSTSTADLCRF